MENRKIIHIDMDAFFASVEQRDHPEYQGKPVIVGGLPDKRGVVAACSYEARQFGIHSAMPSSTAYRLCPNAIFLRPHIDNYREVSIKIQSIFKRYTDLVEPLSLDEAYLDVTECTEFQGSATLIARSIKKTIKDETDLTASAGVSYNKFLAKIASDMDKPDGLYLITPEQGSDFVEQLPVRKFHGIGKATEAKMRALGISCGADLRQWKENLLIKKFGKAGRYYYQISRGIDERPVRNNRIRKSIGSETTFQEDLNDVDVMLSKLKGLSEKVFLKLCEKDMAARTVTLKVKYNNFELVTRSITRESSFKNTDEIMSILSELIQKTEVSVRKVRLLGVSTSTLEPVNQASNGHIIDDEQLALL